LCFPYIFRGALDVGASGINEAMKVACVHAIAELARREASDVAARAYGGAKPPHFGRDYLIPQPFDPRLVVQLPPAVAKAAMDSGVARRPIEDFEAYNDKLTAFVFRTGLTMKPVYERAKADPRRVVYAEGEEETTLRAAQVVVDEGLAKPILIGRPEVIAERIERAGLRLEQGRDVELVNINSDPRFEEYWQHYHRVMERRGVNPSMAKAVIRSRSSAIAAVMVDRGEAGAMICGLVGQYHKKLKYITNVIGLDTGVEAPSSMTALATDKGLFFFVDTHVQDHPTPEQIAEATLQAVIRLKLFGVHPRVALLSQSNFGSSEMPGAAKMRRALQLILERAPRLEVEGEMQADMALDPELRERYFPHSHMTGKANVFVFPNMDAANTAYNMTRMLADGVSIGPILLDRRARRIS
jgi:malate dehydrogenase (oxaloacetate-decarboxylating)(NADP+)